MPLTPAEMMRQYQKKLKENEEVYEKTKDKEKLQKISNDQKPS